MSFTGKNSSANAGNTNSSAQGVIGGCELRVAAGLKPAIGEAMADARGWTKLEQHQLRQMFKLVQSDKFQEAMQQLGGEFLYDAIPTHVKQAGGDDESHCEPSVHWTMDTSLHLYARCGRADAARIQLRHGADAEIRNAQGFTPLLLAARYNQLQVLQALLQHGAQADAFAPLNTDVGHGVELGTCVHFAAESGHVHILKFLVTAAALDADERTCGSQEITALHLAARLGRADVVRFLVARTDVDVNARDARGMTPLHHACDYPNTANSTVSQGDSRSPPQYLFNAAHVEVVDALVYAGAALDVRRASDWATPMRCALHRGHFLVAKTLADHGAYSGVAWWLHKMKALLSTPIRTRNAAYPSESSMEEPQQWKTRLISESLWGTDLLTENETTNSLRSQTQRYESALHEACKSQNVRRLRKALKGHGSSLVNGRVVKQPPEDFIGWTSLHIAASTGWQTGLVLLIAHGADVDLTTSGNEDAGTTALHLAAHNGHTSSVLTLLNAGANIDACDDLGDTPLLGALRHGRSGMVRLLLRHGAPYEYQKELASVLDPPRSGGCFELMLGSFDPRTTSALHLAAFFGALPVVHELVENSNSLFILDAVDDDGATPIWLAALMGHLNVVDFLAQQGASLHHRVAGDSATDCAAEFGHLDVVEYISTSSPDRHHCGSRSLTRLALLDKCSLGQRTLV
ncbi:hypothetical protein PRIC2_003168 [Phytophthora ramorum]